MSKNSEEKESLVTINNERENSLTFQVNVQGIEKDDMAMRFVIESNGIMLGFACEQLSENDYKVTIPALPFVDIGTHDCKIEVVANEYFFTALNGKIKVTGTPKVEAAITTEEPLEEEETPVSVIVGSIKNDETVQESVEVEQPTQSEESDKDQRVRDILKSMGYTKPGPKSLKDYLKN